LSSAVEAIKSEILKRSQTEAQKIISEAEKKAEEILSSAEKKAKEVLEKSIKPEIAVMRKRVLGAARLEGRKAVLQAKDEVLSKVFGLVEERLKRIVEGKDPEYKYEEILFGLLKEAASKIGEEELIVTSNKKTLNYLNRNLEEIKEELKRSLGYDFNLKVENSPYDCIGGVVVYNPKKTKLFYNTLDGRLFELKSKLRGEVAKTLFG